MKKRNLQFIKVIKSNRCNFSCTLLLFLVFAYTSSAQDWKQRFSSQLYLSNHVQPRFPGYLNVIDRSFLQLSNWAGAVGLQESFRLSNKVNYTEISAGAGFLRFVGGVDLKNVPGTIPDSDFGPFLFNAYEYLYTGFVFVKVSRSFGFRNNSLIAGLMAEKHYLAHMEGEPWNENYYKKDLNSTYFFTASLGYQFVQVPWLHSISISTRIRGFSYKAVGLDALINIF